MGTVVFDLDGTLADTSADLIAAANTVLARQMGGVPLDPQSDRSVAFRGARAMLRRGFERGGHSAVDVEVEKHYPNVLEAYASALHVETALYPGARSAVEALRRDGYATAICTNKPEDLAEKLLVSLDIRHLFDALVGADTYPVRKPDPLPLRQSIARAGGHAERAILIGDTETDRETARAASVPCVLVTFGPDGGNVSALEPEALLHHFDDLTPLVDELVGRPGNT